MIEKKLPLSADTFCFVLQACISDKEAGFRLALVVSESLRIRFPFPLVYLYLNTGRRIELIIPIIATLSLSLERTDSDMNFKTLVSITCEPDNRAPYYYLKQYPALLEFHCVVTYNEMNETCASNLLR